MDVFAKKCYLVEVSQVENKAKISGKFKLHLLHNNVINFAFKTTLSTNVVTHFYAKLGSNGKLYSSNFSMWIAKSNIYHNILLLIVFTQNNFVNTTIFYSYIY